MPSGKDKQSAPSSSLTANALWSAFGNLLYSIGRILIVVILTKRFSSDVVGELIFALAVVTPVSFLVNMEVRSVYVTDTKNHFTPGLCLTTRLVSNGAFIVLLAMVCWVGLDGWGWHKAVLILLAGLVRSAESIGDVYLGVLQKAEQMKCWAISQTAKTSLVLISVAVMTFFVTDEIVWLLIAWLGATVAVVWLYDCRMAGKLERFALCWNRTVVGELMKRSLPLGFFVAMTSFNANVAPYFIEHHLGDKMVAYFGAMMMFVNGAAAIQNGVNHATLPRLARYHGEVSVKFWSVLGKVLAISWLGMLVMLAVVYWQGEMLLTVVFKSEYASQAPLFTLIILSGCVILTGMILGDAIVACHRYKSRMTAVAMGLATNIIVCGMLIDDHGLKAAVWAILAAAAVTTLMCAVVLAGVAIQRKNQ